MKQVTIAILGAGNRGMNAYASFIKEKKDLGDKVKIVAVADRHEERINKFKAEHQIPEEFCFRSAEELLAQPKLADGIIVATQDQQHLPHCMAALAKGYDVLLEKPIATTAEDCLTIAAEAKRLGRKVMVCHVLRYTVFYQTIKNMLASGKIGEVVSIEANEDVGYWHQAHSFVRGNWRNSDSSGPMILTKSCHDMDLLSWLMNKKCAKISSFGDLFYFREEKAPAGATKRCFDGCQVKETCPYDAEKIYITGSLGIQNDSLFPSNTFVVNPTEEKVREALETGPYGRCVFHCDNNVVDHQVVNASFEDGSTASFTMCAFGNAGRNIKIMGTLGYLYTQDFGNVIVMKEHGLNGEKYECVDIRTLTDDFSGHGGGDSVLLEDFVNLLHDETYTNTTMTTLEDSLQSHLMAFAAESSRVSGGRVVEL